MVISAAENGPAPAGDPTPGAPGVGSPTEEAGDGACNANTNSESDDGIIWIIDNYLELIVYSGGKVLLDALGIVFSVVGIVAAADTVPATAGASFALAVSSLEVLSSSVIDFAYDVVQVIEDIKLFRENGEIDVTVDIVGFFFSDTLIDLYKENSGE